MQLSLESEELIWDSAIYSLVASLIGFYMSDRNLASQFSKWDAMFPAEAGFQLVGLKMLNVALWRSQPQSRPYNHLRWRRHPHRAPIYPNSCLTKLPRRGSRTGPDLPGWQRGDQPRRFRFGCSRDRPGERQERDYPFS
jgi:hypothetical protein